MIFWIVGVLFALTAFLMVLRFFKKKDPFGELDPLEKENRLQQARRASTSSDPEGSYKNRNGTL